MFDDPETRITRLEAKIEGLESLLNTAIGAINSITGSVNMLIDRASIEDTLTDKSEISDQVLPS